MYINSVSLMTSSTRKDKPALPSFGRVIKTRFFEVLPDGSKAQIQDYDILKEVCRRLTTYHLGQPNKSKKNRINSIPKFFAEIDKDYANQPLVRRIFNFNRYYDHCVYLITGKDAVFLDDCARACNPADRRSEIIQNHWALVRNPDKRLKDVDNQELSLNVFLKSTDNSKGKKAGFVYKGMELIKEQYMQFPYRKRNQNLP